MTRQATDFTKKLPAEISATVFFYSPIYCWPLVIEEKDIIAAIRKRTEELDEKFLSILRACFPEGWGPGPLELRTESDNLRPAWRHVMKACSPKLDAPAISEIEKSIVIIVSGYLDIESLGDAFCNHWLCPNILDWDASFQTPIQVRDASGPDPFLVWKMKRSTVKRVILSEIGGGKRLRRHLERASNRYLAWIYTQRKLGDTLFSFYGLLYYLGADTSALRPSSILFRIGMLRPAFTELLKIRGWWQASAESEDTWGRYSSDVVRILSVLAESRVGIRGRMRETDEERRVVEECFRLLRDMFRRKAGTLPILSVWGNNLRTAFDSFPQLYDFFHEPPPLEE